MFFEHYIQLNQWLETLQEPQRFFAFIGIMCGLPLLCVALLCIDKKLESKRDKRNADT